MNDCIVIGGGAAGFFGAIQLAEKKPRFRIRILEKSSKVLTKVKVSGGGRCNVTHYEYKPSRLARHYPRGEKPLKAMFKKFQASDVVNWFAEKGISLKAEEDGRMFPVTDKSQTIIDCFLQETRKYNIVIELNNEVVRVEKHNSHFVVSTKSGENYLTRNILVAIGGHAKREAYSWIEQLGHWITPLVPSLFTFNDPSRVWSSLMGIAVTEATVKIAGTKFFQQGPLLITHWGLSGPAVIKLSAWAAEYLNSVNYAFTVLVNWTGDMKEDELRAELLQLKNDHPKQKIISNPLFHLPHRLWAKHCEEAEIPETKIWGEISMRSLNKLIEQLIRCSFSIKGKTTYKEEFVTCGGVDLAEINTETMESKKMEGLYFAGEVLNIDGETGGFNFQAAWTTAWVAAQTIARKPGFSPA